MLAFEAKRPGSGSLAPAATQGIGRDVVHNDLAVAYKTAKGPRPELQDLPFSLRLRYTDRGFVTGEPPTERTAEDWEKDLFINGIIDGMGGSRVRLEPAAAAHLFPVLSASGLMTPGVDGTSADTLTGRAAADYLLSALERRATDLAPGGSAGGYGLAALLADLNSDLYAFNKLLFDVAIAEPAPVPLGAALSIAILDRHGTVRYGNCGDCRAAVIRVLGEGFDVEELSEKQTMASLQCVGDRTTAGLVDDHRILNALGTVQRLRPALTDSRLFAHDILVHLTDGAKEALMQDLALASITWDARTLATTLRASVAPSLIASPRLFPSVHRLFLKSVIPRLASPSAGGEGLVLDNASVLAARRAETVPAALEYLFQAIDVGDARIRRSPFKIERSELMRLARAAGVFREQEERELCDRVGACGMTIVERIEG